MKFRLLSLFAGIGGFELGLERSGYFETVAQCEIDPYCNRVLAKHWPSVKRYDDVRTLSGDRLVRDGIAVDAICGGFPCQDISTAGKGAGIGGSRSGLWKEYARIIGETRPRYVVVENVSALLARGMGTVLADLSAIGYDAEWRIISAADVGAPHLRERVWIVAYPNEGRFKPANWREIGSKEINGERCASFRANCKANVANPKSERRRETRQNCERQAERIAICGNVLAHSERLGPSGSWEPIIPLNPAPRLNWEAIEPFNGGVGSIWATEPELGRVANGISGRVDRLKGLGNAVVPQIPEIIGRAIGEYESRLNGTPQTPAER